MAVEVHGLFVHIISLSPHDGAPMSQMVFTLPFSHRLNLVHLAGQSVDIVRFLDLELGLGDD